VQDKRHHCGCFGSADAVYSETLPATLNPARRQAAHAGRLARCPATSTPSDVSALTAMLDVACRKCGRRGRLHIARLRRDRGPSEPVPDLIRALVGECPRLRSTDIRDRCDAHCPDISALFAGSAAVPGKRGDSATIGWIVAE
jgi:hypothetical protein